METPWTKSPQQILEHYVVDPARGLTADQAAKHAEIYGKNGEHLSLLYTPLQPLKLLVSPPELPEDPATPLWELILEQFKDQLVLILLGSAVVSFALALLEESDGSSWGGAFVEPIVILLILVANAAVGVIQESSAEKAIDVSHLSRSCPEVTYLIIWMHPGAQRVLPG